MSGGGNFKVTITEHDYNFTTYTAWVSATSRNQAIVMAAAMAGQEKIRREFERTGRPNDLYPAGLLAPEVKIETVSLDEFWDKRDTVEVSE